MSGTDAKEVLIHFSHKTGTSLTRAFAGFQTNIVKDLLEQGYTRSQLIKAIDFAVDVKRIRMYSLGFIKASIDELLKQIDVHEIAKDVMIELEVIHAKEGEVKKDESSAERNRSKLHRFGAESRFREKYHFDLFEKSGQVDRRGEQ